MIIFLITFITLLLVMLALGTSILLGRASELRRGCGDDCECLRAKRARPAPCPAQHQETGP